MKDEKRIILIPAIFLFLVLIFFSGLTKSFFQQDEWAIFGFLIYWGKAGLNWFQRLFVYEQEVHILPFSNLLSYFQFKLFGLNFAPYAIFSILLHSLNSFLVFYLSYLILKKKWLSFTVGLLFAVNSISHQTVTWIATSTGTAGTTLFFLLALIFFVRKNLILSILMLVLSLGFKETSVFLFGILPLFWLMFSKEKTFDGAKKIFLPLLIIGFLYFCLRFLLFINAPPSSAPAGTVSQPITPVVYLYRLFTLPLKAISQSIIPASLILGLSKIMVILAYPHFAPEGVPDPYMVETVAADIVSYGLTTLMLILSWFVFKYLKTLKEDNLSKSLIFSLSFIALGCLPFIFIPGKAGYFSIFEPRHFYILSIGSSLFLGLLIFALSQWLARKNARWLFSVFLIFILLLHSFKIWIDIQNQAKVGELRKSILIQISSAYPKLPEKVIFYTESDKAFYSFPPEEKILPFQSGFGQTLLIWYTFKGENFPACFYQGQYLYVLLSQDYKECEGRGFGYFRNLDKLKMAVKENHLGADNMIAFDFNSKTNKLTDITQKVRNQIR